MATSIGKMRFVASRRTGAVAGFQKCLFEHVFEGWVSTLISTDQPRLAAAVSLRYVMSVRAALAHVKTRGRAESIRDRGRAGQGSKGKPR
jgi:hypothetical protein